MIQINSNSLMNSKGLTPLNRLSEDMVNTINDLRTFLMEKFKIERVSQLFIFEDKLATTSKGTQYILLNEDMGEYDKALVDKIKNI